MANSSRFRFPKTVLFVITALYIVVICANYFLYFQKQIIDCAKQIIVGQLLALAFQVVLNYVNYRSNEKIVVLATLFVSAMLFSGVLSSFFNLQLMCKYFGY